MIRNHNNGIGFKSNTGNREADTQSQCKIGQLTGQHPIKCEGGVRLFQLRRTPENLPPWHLFTGSCSRIAPPQNGSVNQTQERRWDWETESHTGKRPDITCDDRGGDDRCVERQGLSAAARPAQGGLEFEGLHVGGFQKTRK